MIILLNSDCRKHHQYTKCSKINKILYRFGNFWNVKCKISEDQIHRSTFILGQCRQHEVLTKTYHALFNSHLQYAISCWGTTTQSNLYHLQVLQNRVVRNMFKAPRFFRLDNYFLNYRFLKVRDLYNLEIAKFMHGHHNNLLPDCFTDFFHERSETHSYNTRSSRRRNYTTVAFQSIQGQRSIRYQGPNIWNKIPDSSRNLKKYPFKKYYKDLILSNY